MTPSHKLVVSSRWAACSLTFFLDSSRTMPPTHTFILYFSSGLRSLFVVSLFHSFALPLYIFNFSSCLKHVLMDCVLEIIPPVIVSSPLLCLRPPPRLLHASRHRIPHPHHSLTCIPSIAFTHSFAHSFISLTHRALSSLLFDGIVAKLVSLPFVDLDMYKLSPC